jgi:hypothetical protein
MKRIIILPFALFALYLTGTAQASLQPSQDLKTAIVKLEPLIGEWKGEGWVQMGSAKHVFQQQESISLKANNTVIQIEGLGMDESGQAVHQAFAIISFDSEKAAYQMLAVRADGKVIYPEILITETGVLEWGFDVGNGGRVKFNIEIKGDTWHETGKFSSNGTNWISFLEMNLKKETNSNLTGLILNR